MLQVTSTIAVPDAELQFSFARSGGPGGQNVNKVSSKVLLRWNPAASGALPDDVKARLLAQLRARLTTEGELLITSQRTRDQGKNIADCQEKLRSLIVQALHAPKPRRPSKPTRGSKERRLAEKRQRSGRKEARRKGVREE